MRLSFAFSRDFERYQDVMPIRMLSRPRNGSLRCGSMTLRQHKFRDIFLYIAIALLVVVSAFGYAVYMARTGKEPAFKNDWFVTIATAALVFGRAIRNHWRERRVWSFWAGWFGLLIAHCAILLLIFSLIEKVPLILIAVIAPLEIFIVYPALNLVTGRFNSRRA